MSARTSRDAASSSRWKAFFPIVDAVYVMLALSVCVLMGCASLLVVCFLPFPVAETCPWLCVALALSAPGIAAAFAIYRDHPVSASVALCRDGIWGGEGVLLIRRNRS